ncbi:TetR/AcrR family transcriptional regulator [Nocardioides zeae]|uniref:TetR/AcrR family transcriptional regulator n=1 Tax=Nocardioides imazamoxiresistens TaxID=3231893 RepID=A0ABU3PSJ8_9ACTN|nr:TetR/AcrR family transcriptional regulator [Nocardioides zeae]MDT9592201.1 TetR/AcrR family transcriptional regulator [Nocardioides zeae]
MTVPSPPARSRLEAEARREQILLAAQRLFAERPFESVSTKDIAVASGTTRTNIYHHFPTKRDLFLEVIERFGRGPADGTGADGAGQPDDGVLLGDGQATPVAGPGPDGSVEEHVATVLGRWLDLVDHNRQMFITMLHASSSTDPQVSGVLVASMQAWESRLARIVGLDPDDPAHHAMVRAYQSSVSAATAAWLDDGELDKEQVRRFLTEGLLAVARAAGVSGSPLR